MDDALFDKYEQYADDYETANTSRQARRGKTTPAGKRQDQIRRDTVAQLSDRASEEDLALNFNPTYRPSKYEAGWLVSSLNGFYDRALIVDVLGLVKGGKEASVYRCAAHPSTGVELLAAKVYRPRQFRSLSNDALYKEGRPIIDATGRAYKKTDHREMRALGKKSAYGLQLAHTSWLAYEFTTLQRLYDAGAAVPRPVASADNAILMGYQGDAGLAAPTLIEVGLAQDEAHDLFKEVMRNVELLLSLGYVHGDLSAYNILYWEGQITLIDFPQVVSIEGNRGAYDILERDVTRVCDYFERQGVDCDPDRWTSRLWAAHGRKAQEMLDMNELDLGEER